MGRTPGGGGMVCDGSGDHGGRGTRGQEAAGETGRGGSAVVALGSLATRASTRVEPDSMMYLGQARALA